MSKKHVVPAIQSVTDPEGNAVRDYGITNFTTLHLEGTAGVGADVEVILGGNVVATVTAKEGHWKYVLENLDRGRIHRIWVRSDGEDSRYWTVTVDAKEIEKPLITEVLDWDGNLVPDGGSTDATTLEPSGTADVGASVSVYVDGLLQAAAYASDGTWRAQVHGLGMNAYHAIQASANNRWSNIWNVTVGVVHGAAWITAIRDADGYDIPYAGYTASTTVDIVGKAPPHQPVTVFTNASHEVSVIADAEGLWSTRLAGLSEQFYIVTVSDSAGAHDGRFRCVDPRLPIIRLAKDSKGNPIPINGSTRDRSVVLTGTGAAGEVLTLQNRTVVVGNPRVNDDGVWAWPVSDLSDAIHVFRVSGSYGGGLVPHDYHFHVY